MTVKADTYIQERLDSLHAIEHRIASFLDNISEIFGTFLGNPEDKVEQKKQFEGKVKQVYEQLSRVAIDLRKEVKVMDDNTGVYDKNSDGVMILPIAVDQKNTTLGRKKMKEQLCELSRLVGEPEIPEIPDVPEPAVAVEIPEVKQKVDNEPVTDMADEKDAKVEDVEVSNSVKMDIESSPATKTEPETKESVKEEVTADAKEVGSEQTQKEVDIFGGEDFGQLDDFSDFDDFEDAEEVQKVDSKEGSKVNEVSQDQTKDKETEVELPEEPEAKPVEEAEVINLDDSFSGDVDLDVKQESQPPKDTENDSRESSAMPTDMPDLSVDMFPDTNGVSDIEMLDDDLF